MMMMRELQADLIVNTVRHRAFTTSDAEPQTSLVPM